MFFPLSNHSVMTQSGLIGTHESVKTILKFTAATLTGC